jgi:hypothetical protein
LWKEKENREQISLSVMNRSSPLGPSGSAGAAKVVATQSEIEEPISCEVRLRFGKSIPSKTEGSHAPGLTRPASSAITIGQGRRTRPGSAPGAPDGGGLRHRLSPATLGLTSGSGASARVVVLSFSPPRLAARAISPGRFARARPLSPPGGGEALTSRGRSCRVGQREKRARLQPCPLPGVNPRPSGAGC